MKRKVEQAHKLAMIAMTKGPEWKPSPGYTYIKDVRIGELVETPSFMRAIVLDNSSSSTTVLVTSVECHSPSDRSFYLGKHRWGSTTEVKVIGD